MQLAQSLAALRPELNGYLEEWKNKHREDEANRAYDAFQGMTYEDARAAVESGEMLRSESPWFQAAFAKQFGLAHAAERRREIVSAYNTSFDRENGDVGEFLRSYVQADQEAYGDNHFIMAGMREGMAGVFDEIKNQNREFRDTVAQQRAGDQFFQIARGAVDQAIAAGGDPSAAVWGLYDQHRESLGLTYGEMDAYTMQLATQLAEEGNLAAVESLLTADIVASDGTRVGSFTSRPAFAADAQRLIDTAKANQGQNVRGENTTNMVGLRDRANTGTLTDADRALIETYREGEVISQEMAEGLLVQNDNARARAGAAASEAVLEQNALTATTEALLAGRGWSITDMDMVNANGEVVTFKADALRERAVQEAVDNLAAGGATPPQIAAHLASWGVAETYEPWENLLSSGYLGLSQALTRAGEGGSPTVPENAMTAYQLFKQLGDNPNLRDRHIMDSTAQKVYSDAQTLEQFGMDAQEALVTAASINRSESRASLSGWIDPPTFQRAVGRVVENGWGEDILNGSDMAMAIETQARILIDKGMTMDAAVAAAAQRVQDSTTVINGVGINTRNAFVPQDFADVSTRLIQSVGGEDADELTLVPTTDGSNYWTLVYRDTMAIPADVGKTRWHISEIMAHRPAPEEGTATGSATRESTNAAITEQAAQEAPSADSQGDPMQYGIPLSEEWIESVPMGSLQFALDRMSARTFARLSPEQQAAIVARAPDWADGDGND